MAKRVAWCLVENDADQVLLVQLGYGKQKSKWSLPGGACKSHESYHRAAARETREETGLGVDIVSLIRESNEHAHKTYFGRIRSGRLKAKYPECLDAKFFDYDHLPPLAYSANLNAVREWQKMKSTHSRLASKPRTPPCPNCGSDNTRLRHYPHHNPYRCRSCNRVFANEPVTNTFGTDKEVVVTYATDGSSMIVDRINQRRERVGAASLQISVPLREMARKFITMSSFDEAADSLDEEAQSHGYGTGGWTVRMYYGGSYTKFPSGGETSITETEMADIIATQLIKEWSVLLRPDWQDIGIAGRVGNHPELGGLSFQVEFVVGWRIPPNAERPAHFPRPIDLHGNPIRDPVHQELQPKPQQRSGWWPFRS